MGALNTFFKKNKAHITILDLYITLAEDSIHAISAKRVGEELFKRENGTWGDFKDVKAAIKFVKNNNTEIIQIAHQSGVKFKEARDVALFFKDQNLLPLKNV